MDQGPEQHHDHDDDHPEHGGLDIRIIHAGSTPIRSTRTPDWT
jgi:hypothetical protein